MKGQTEQQYLVGPLDDEGRDPGEGGDSGGVAGASTTLSNLVQRHHSLSLPHHLQHLCTPTNLRQPHTHTHKEELMSDWKQERLYKGIQRNTKESQAAADLLVLSRLLGYNC